MNVQNDIQHFKGDLVTVFSNENPRPKTAFTIQNSRGEVLNVAEVQRVRRAASFIANPNKRFAIEAVIIA